MTPREKRVAFTAATVRLLNRMLTETWSYGKVEFAFDEGTIRTPRRVRFDTGATSEVEDARHKRGSRHYDGLALDLLVYIDGVYITDGAHPIWKEIDAMAGQVDPLLSLGIDFHDANHLSWDEGAPAPLTPAP